MHNLENLNHSGMKCNFHFLLFFVLLGSLFSCKKSGNPDGNSNKPVSVYITGSVHKGLQYFPAYWENGNFKALQDSTQAGSTNAITVSGKDVYVAGSQSNGQYSVAKWWKNGIPYYITSGSTWAIATSIAVSGNDVYVAGSETKNPSPIKVAMMWKNNLPIPLSNGLFPTEAFSIAVSGKDVYVAGIRTGGTDRMAIYWKNGVLTYLTKPIVQSAEARSIAVSGNDVYVAGMINGRAVYWKNDSLKDLKRTSNYSEANAIAISARDVYVVGIDGSGTNKVAKCWKNGEVIMEGPKNSEALCISVAGDEIYLAGLVAYKPVYWKIGNSSPFLIVGINQDVDISKPTSICVLK